jgi:hypothetical protein
MARKLEAILGIRSDGELITIDGMVSAIVEDRIKTCPEYNKEAVTLGYYIVCAFSFHLDK